jgi:general secretion pathway protein D
VPGYDVAIDFDRKAGPVARVAQLIRQEEQRVENGGPGLPGDRVIAPGAPGGAPPRPGGSVPPSSSAPLEPPSSTPSRTPADPRTREIVEELMNQSSPDVREPQAPPSSEVPQTADPQEQQPQSPGHRPPEGKP